LLAAIGAKGDLSAQEMADHITASVDQFRGDVPATDDITILVTKAMG
jgi:serine phosphatase RsbU (regulator of sigma subunit)